MAEHQVHGSAEIASRVVVWDESIVCRVTHAKVG